MPHFFLGVSHVTLHPIPAILPYDLRPLRRCGAQSIGAQDLTQSLPMAHIPKKRSSLGGLPCSLPVSCCTPGVNSGRRDLADTPSP